MVDNRGMGNNRHTASRGMGSRDMANSRRMGVAMAVGIPHSRVMEGIRLSRATEVV